MTNLTSKLLMPIFCIYVIIRIVYLVFELANTIEILAIRDLFDSDIIK